MRAIIVADGDVSGAGQLEQSLTSADSPADSPASSQAQLVIAADGGAMKAIAIGLKPDVVVGDADSLTPDELADLQSRGIELILHPVQKDESDTELCLREAIRRGADAITIVGAFGGPRIEHAIANLLLLTLPELSGHDVSIVHGGSEIRVLTGGPGVRLEVSGAVGDFVSLLPLTEEVRGVTTVGLRYPLADATLEQGRARGLSNELELVTATVSATSGHLAVISTRREASPDA